VLASIVTSQLVFDGVVSGLVYGLLACGIVLVYRATRVINFAVGNMGLVGTGLFVLLAVQYGVPYGLAAIVGLVVGTVYGALIHLVVIRRLFDAPRVIVLVATIGIAQLSLAILAAYPDIDVRGARFPQAIASAREIGSVRITGAQLTILLVVPLVAGVLAWFLTRTTFGKSVKASAENRDLARLNGISPKQVSMFVWATAGALATLSISLIAAQSGSAREIGLLGSSTLVRALAAAVIGGMVSFNRAFFAGIAIGVAEVIVGFNFPDQAGLVDFLILIAILVAVYFQSRQSAGETQSFSFTPKRRPIPERLKPIWWVRNTDRAALVVLLIGAIVLPIIVTQTSRHLLYTTVLVFAFVGMSLTILTGWAGQLSLGQMAFAGIGALLAAAFRRGIRFDIGVGDTRLIHGAFKPLTFGVSIALAALLTAALAALIGVGALRVRGLLLAVSTFAFGVAASQYFYHRPFLTTGSNDSVPFPRTDFFGISLKQQRSYYYFVLAALVILVLIVARLRRTGVGRATIGVRDNADGASAYTVSATRVKLRTFALAGGIAGLGGALLAGSLQSVPLTRFFTVGDSLMLVSIVVIGGLGSVIGPVIGAMWVIGLPAFFPGNDLVPLLTSSIGLLVLLLYFPGGLIQIAYSARDALFDLVERRMGPAPAKPEKTMPVSLTPSDRPALREGEPALRATDITVKFGGIHAVQDASIEIGAGEIVGLIGTNGAGKSTLMNAIAGYVPSKGTVDLLGERVSSLSSSARARRGLGRTFQAAALFPELSVRETVQLALEARHRTGFLSAALCLPPSIRMERVRRTEADELINFLGLGRYADAYISDLSTGTRRIVELAGLLALDARVLFLDEPTAGLAQRETEAFGPVIIDIRRQLDASVLVIEHDMPLIMGISDRVYCLELGLVIAEGPPDAVRNDPAVIASYLGTDERAIARSGTVGDAPQVVQNEG
jgi:ABC-type branched-subunit amino acid transport system ATPase component/ABC-type branched-subunit amino acid transport system permease subunit